MRMMRIRLLPASSMSCLVSLLRPLTRQNLRGEVGVMLSAAPQQEDQVHRIDRVHFARIDPRLKHRRTASEPGAVILIEIFGQAFTAADHFHRKDSRGLRLTAGELHLGANVPGQRFGWIVLGR